MNDSLSKLIDRFHRIRAGFQKKNLGKALNNLFTLIVIIALGVYVYQHQESLEKIKEFKVVDVLVIFLLQILNLFILSLFNLVMMKRIEPRVTISDSIFLQYVNNFFNNILFRGGSIYRAVYLKKQYNFPYSRFISTMTGLYVITFLTNSLAGLISVIVISNKYGQSETILILIFLGVLVGSSFIALLKPKVIKSQNRIIRILNSVIIGWKTIKTFPKDILILLFLSVINLTLRTIQIFYIFRALGVGPGWFEMSYLATLDIIMQIVNITPSGVGIRETVFAFSSSVIPISDEILVLGSLIIRAIAIPSSILAGTISYVMLQKRMNKNSIKIQT